MSLTRKRAIAIVLLTALVATPAAADPPASPRRACPDAQPPAGAESPEGAARQTVAAVTNAARLSRPVAVVPGLVGFCTTREGVFIGSAEVAAAGGLERGRLAYALGAWAAGYTATPFDAELQAARFAGCALSRLGLRGDELTTQLLDLREWSGPHPDARAWTQAAQEGHAACAR